VTPPAGESQLLPSGIRVHGTRRHTDPRGWLLKVLQGHQTGTAPFGEIYITSCTPGATRAGHLHHKTREWFCPLRGRGLLVTGDAQGATLDRIEMDDGQPVVIEVPPGVAHLVIGGGTEPFLLLAYADRAYDPADPDTLPVTLRA
jgi:dTDP-4-dehydrorhamnose 3,5-epimerase-like enzyme